PLRVGAARQLVLAPLAREERPQPPYARLVPPAAARFLAVAIVVVPVPSRTVRRVDFDRAVDDRERRGDERRARRPNAEPHELEESGVDDAALVVSAAAVVDLERLAAVGCAVLRRSHVIRLSRQRPR